MRREILYLWDINEAADHIAEFLLKTDFEEFQESEILRSAVVQKLCVIGKAAARLPEDLKSRHAEIPWPGSSLSEIFLFTATSESIGGWFSR